MMNNDNQCPKCKQYIFGEYCYNCKIDIKEFSNEELIPDFLKDMFKEKKDE